MLDFRLTRCTRLFGDSFVGYDYGNVFLSLATSTIKEIVMPGITAILAEGDAFGDLLRSLIYLNSRKIGTRNGGLSNVV